MKRCCAAMLITFVVSLAVHAAPSKTNTNYDLTGWRTLSWSSNRVVASGGSPLVKSGDGKLRLSASKIVLTMAGKEKSRQTVATAEAVGAVKIHAVPGPAQQIDAICQKAVIYPSAQRAELTGSVKVVIRDRTKSSGVIELSGDTMTLYLKDGRVVATSRPSHSRLKTTPASGKGH
jgi:lipopolysaccharide export system protein LptA